MKITGRISLLVLSSLVSIQSMAIHPPSISRLPVIKNGSSSKKSNSGLLPEVERGPLCREIVQIDVDSLQFTQVVIGERVELNVPVSQQRELTEQADAWAKALIEAAADPEGRLNDLKNDLIANSLEQTSQDIQDLIAGNTLLEKQDKGFSGKTLNAIEESDITTKNIVKNVLEGQELAGRASDEIAKSARAFTEIQNEIQPPTGLAGVRYKLGKKFNALHDRMASGGKIARFVSKAIPSVRTTQEYKTYADRILAVVNGMTVNVGLLQEAEVYLGEFQRKIQDRTRALPEQIFFEHQLARAIEAWVQSTETEKNPIIQILRHNVEQHVWPMIESQLSSDQELLEKLNLLTGTIQSAKQAATDTKMQTTIFQRNFVVSGVTSLTASSALDMTQKTGAANRLAKNAADASAAYAVDQANQAQNQILANMELMGSFRESAMKLAKKAEENTHTFEANRLTLTKKLANKNDQYMQEGASGVLIEGEKSNQKTNQKPKVTPTPRLSSSNGIPSVPPVVGQNISKAPIYRADNEE